MKHPNFILQDVEICFTYLFQRQSIRLSIQKIRFTCLLSIQAKAAIYIENLRSLLIFSIGNCDAYFNNLLYLPVLSPRYRQLRLSILTTCFTCLLSILANQAILFNNPINFIYSHHRKMPLSMLSLFYPPIPNTGKYSCLYLYSVLPSYFKYRQFSYPYQQPASHAY